MDISEIFEAECFTTVIADAGDTTTKYSYNEATNTYTLDNDHGTYYISKNAKIWLFVLYDYSGVDSTDMGGGIRTGTGVASSYTAKSSTFGNMMSTFGNVSQDIMDATVRQLVQAKVIDEGSSNYSSLYPYTINEVLAKMSSLL